jgi:hypothetical protein
VFISLEKKLIFQRWQNLFSLEFNAEKSENSGDMKTPFILLCFIVAFTNAYESSEESSVLILTEENYRDVFQSGGKPYFVRLFANW